MDDVRGATESLIEERPELEGELREMLAVDEEATGWTFDDIPVDSGDFGELVSEGVVTKTADGDYRLSDPEAVRAALDGERGVERDPDDGFSTPSMGWTRPSVDRGGALALSGALLLVVLLRAWSVPAVFRGDAVVLSSNDPYLYRYWVEELLARSSGPLDLAVLGDFGEVANGEPLLVAVLWFVAALLGGGQHTAGLVLALYPVVAAVVLAVLLYLLAIRLTGDRRVGLAAVVMLAVVPDHALRTAVGFADHHAFDYPWLLLTAYGLVGAIDRPDIRSREGLSATVAIALGVGGQVFAWAAGPLLVLPVGFVVALSALLLVDAGEDPFVAHGPILAGTAAAAVLAWVVHGGLGWQSTTVALTPTLLFGGVLAVTALAGAFVRFGYSDRRSLAAFAGVQAGVAVALGAAVVLTDSVARLSSRLDFLLDPPPIAESQTLFQSDLGLIVAPIFSFGLVLFLAVPYMTWASWRVATTRTRRWLVPVVYGWWFLTLATVQVRFGGELAAFAALFAGVGFVHLAQVVDLTDRVPDIVASDASALDGAPSSSPGSLSTPDRQAARYVVVLLVFIAGIGVLLTPPNIDLTTVEGEEYRTASAIDGYADERNLSYPDDYVFSQWGRNRMYNYFVNGESESYRFAETNYGSFLSATDDERAYRILDDRRGFVVTRDADLADDLPEDSVGVRLHERWGSRGESTAGLGHYRAVYATDDGSTKAFHVVPGAVVEGNASPGTRVTVATDVSVSGHEFTYERTATANADGVYRVRVAYAGEYRVGDDTVSVTAAQVLGNETASLFDNEGSYWPMNVGEGDVAYDPRSGNHARLRGATWTTRDGQPAVEFGRSGSFVASGNTSLDASDGFVLSTRFRTNESVDYVDDVPYPRIAMKAEPSPFRETDGYQITMVQGELRAFVGDGDSVLRLRGPRVDDDEWHHVSLRWNGTSAALVLDGEVVDSGTFDGTVESDAPLRVSFPGAIDDLRLRSHGSNASELVQPAARTPDDAAPTSTPDGRRGGSPLGGPFLSVDEVTRSPTADESTYLLL